MAPLGGLHISLSTMGKPSPWRHGGADQDPVAGCRSAPLTCLDPASDGRWQTLHPRSVVYLASIPNQSVRDVLALYGLIKASLGDKPLYCRLAGYAAPMQKIMQEQQVRRIHQLSPDTVLPNLRGEAEHDALALAASIHGLGWNNLSNAVEQYGEQLTQNSEKSSPRSFFARC